MIVAAATLGKREACVGKHSGTKAGGFRSTAGYEMEKPIVVSDFVGVQSK